MPTQDLVHYRSEESAYPVIRGGGSSDNSSSLFLGSGQEDWVTKKRIETKTTKNVEKRVQRQVVLEDGRIIEEDDPEITVDTIEDTQSHDEDGDEDRRHFYNDNWATTPRDTWSATGDVLSEKNQRNVFTKNIQERSVTTASAKNLGEISSKDVDKIIRHGKRTRQFIRAHDDDSSSTDPVSIPAKVIHTGKSNRILVDREDIREINRMQDGKVKTERHVTREMIEDTGNETPEEGESTEETESRDGDRDGFAQRKEERFVDYYRVPRNKPLKDGQFLSHGIHLTSYDKTERQGKGVSALAYHRDDRSDSTPPGSSGGWPSRPPRSSDHHRRRRSSSATGKRSGTPRIVAAAPSTPRDTPERFNTIERSTWRHGSKDQNGSSRGTPIRRDSKEHSSFRSRSISRSPVPTTNDSRRSGGSSIRTGDHASHHRSMTTLRSDLDDDRAGRLKRAMSFSTKSVGPLGAGGSRAGSVSRPETPSQPKATGTGTGLGLLGSVKSLYATIRRGSKTGKENKTPSNDQTKFDNGIDKPQRPPRKHQSSSSVTSGNSGQFNSLDRRQTGKGSSRHSQPSLSTSQNDLGNKWSVYPPPQTQQQQQHQYQQQQQHHSRQVQHHSSSPVTRRETMPTRRDGTSTLRRDTTSSLTRHATSQHRNDNRQYQSTSSFVMSPGSVGSGGSGRHRSSSRSRFDEIDNRNAPRFEPERHRERSRNSRFFGQEDDESLEDEVERERARPPPDMRRLLLSNVNSHRSTSKKLDVKPSVIRAM